MALKKGRDLSLSDCDFCFNRKTRNAKIVHCLKMSESDYRQHLRSMHGEAGEKDGWIQSRITWHRFVWNHYADKAKESHVPIWQAYLEAHNIAVKRAPSPAWQSLPDRVPF